MPANISLFLAVLIVSCRSTQQPENRLLPLLLATHGLEKLSPENRALLHEMKSNPGEFIPSLKNEVTFAAKPADYLTAERTARVSSAYLTLFFIGTPDALSVIAESHLELLDQLSTRWKIVRAYERGDAKSIDPTTENLLKLERSVVSGFRRAKDSRILSPSIEILTTADYATALNALEYIAEVAAADTLAVASAAKAVGNPESSLNKDPLSQSIIKSLLKRLEN
jgi:hypothetical protein